MAQRSRKNLCQLTRKETMMDRRPLIVMKFGGTSVGNSDRFRQCADIVSRAAGSARIIVVVSAVGGVTDLIFKTIDAARRGDAAATEANLKQFEVIHQKLVVELFHGHPARSAAVMDLVNQVVEQLQSSSRALLALRSDVSTQTHDLLAALGERISACVLAHTIQQMGTPSEFVRAENVIV